VTLTASPWHQEWIVYVPVPPRRLLGLNG